MHHPHPSQPPRHPHQDLLPSLRKALESRRPEDPVVVLGVGSELHTDDAAGLRVAAAVSAWAMPGVHALEAGPAPENCTAEIRSLHPSRLIIVDCADMGEEPGSLW